VGGGPLMVFRTVKIIATFAILALAILGLGFCSATQKQIILEKSSFAVVIAVLGSGFSLLVIIGSFISLVPNLGRWLLTLILFIFALVGSTILPKLLKKNLFKKISGSVTHRKLGLVFTILISATLLSVFVQKCIALETNSDAVQIYLPFFEYFQAFGSSSAILERPAFSSFIQLRGLGTHLAATAIGGWTSAQLGSYLAVALIAIVVFWSVTYHFKRAFNIENSESSWFLAGSASFATLLFYSSVELYSKTHVVTFALISVLTVSLPIAIDETNLDSAYFKNTATLASISVCILYPLNFVAVVMVALMVVFLVVLNRKTILVSQVVKIISWAAGSSLLVFAIQLYFVGVLSTEPGLRSIKVGHIFQKFSSEEIWVSLYGIQGMSNIYTYIKEPFVSQGIFSKDSILTIVYLFDARGYLYFVIGTMGLIVLFWEKLNAALISLGFALLVFGFVSFVIFKNVSDVSRVIALLLGTSGLIVIISKIALFDAKQRQSLGKRTFSLPLSPFLLLVSVLCIFSVAQRVIYLPSFERLALQGRLGILLLPVLLCFVLVRVESPNTDRNLISASKQLLLPFTIVASPVLFMAFFQLVFPQRKLIFLALTIFNLVLLTLIVLRVRQNVQFSSRSFDKRIIGLSTSWTIVLLLMAAVGILPTYPKQTNWSVIDWSNQMEADFQGLIGLDGLMPESSVDFASYTKKDIARCLELANMLPMGSKVFPVNGYYEFASCHGTPLLNRGQLVHHYDSILAPRFDEIMSSDTQQTMKIFQESNVNYLVLLKDDCTKFLLSENVAFDAENLSQFHVFGVGSDFVMFDVRFSNQINRKTFGGFLADYLVDYSRSCQPEEIP